MATVGTSDKHNNVEEPEDLAVDWRARSLAVKAFSHAANAASLRGTRGAGAPRVLVQYWDDAAVPTDVAACMATWDPLRNIGFERVTFDRARARRFISHTFSKFHRAAFEAARHPAIRSDYFRLCYLASRGGWYVDADDAYQDTDMTPLLEPRGLRVQALCYNLDDDRMMDAARALAGPDHQNVIHYVNNDPLIARPQHPVLLATLRNATSTLLRQQSIGQVDVQAIAGPGALTLELARHNQDGSLIGAELDVEVRTDWDRYAHPVWDLEYRRDGHDWRTWDGEDSI